MYEEYDANMIHLDVNKILKGAEIHFHKICLNRPSTRMIHRFETVQDTGGSDSEVFPLKNFWIYSTFM